MKTITISLLFLLGSSAGTAGERPAAKKKPPAKKQGVLQAELKIPDTVTISAKQIAKAAEVKKAVSSRATLQKKLTYLSKNAEANRDEIEKLRNKIRGLWMIALMAQKTTNLKQGISVKLILRNTGTSDVTLRHGGDDSNSDIVLIGLGAFNLPYRGPFTCIYIPGKPVTIKAGSTQTLTLNEFKYGKREYSRWLICEPGEYTVTLSYNGVKAKPVAFKVMKK